MTASPVPDALELEESGLSGVNPGERYDALIDCENPGAWAFHCHVLPHAEGNHGMFGMVTALIIS